MRNPDELQKMAAIMERPLEHFLKWKEIVDRFERGKNSVWSKCFLKSEGETVKEREAKAYADPEYVAYLDEWHEASKKAISARVEYENLKNQCEALQSALSYDREAIKRGVL